MVDSLTTFFAILIASLVFRMERLTFRKMLGCLVGFADVILVKIDGTGISFDLLGESGTLGWQNAVSLLLVSIVIVIVNYKSD